MQLGDSLSQSSGIAQAMGASTADAVSKAKLLVVGSGGIGCELLKNLVLSGFRNIQVIDLDTIDVSNLNRQFLFRPHHVGRPKAEVAREAVLAMCPAANITAYHANIKESRFGASFFQQFDLVLNALDNLDARRHVNRLCLATDRPLIESGSTGYLGQTMVIKKDVTECFECQPKAGQKVYPICTIRSTPDKPVHCVVWAKELYKLLLGASAESYLFEEDQDKSVYMKSVKAVPAVDDEAACRAYALDLAKKLFHDEIAEALAMKAEQYKTAKYRPAPIDVDAMLAAPEAPAPTSSTNAPESHRVFEPKYYLHMFLNTVAAIFSSPARRAELGAAQFDKDNDLDLQLVASAANLRAHIFTIPLQSLFELKSIAGNIIPAIATTNAVVAGLQVLEALKIIRGDDIKQKCKLTYVLRLPTRRGNLLQPSDLQPPAPSCFVCSRRILRLAIDTNDPLVHFRDAVLKGALGMVEPSVQVEGGILYEEGEDADDFSDVLPRPLVALGGGGIHDGTVVTVDDFFQSLTVDIQIVHRPRGEFDEEKHPRFFELFGSVPAGTALPPIPAPAPAPAPATAPKASTSDADGDIVMLDGDDDDNDDAADTPSRAPKRARKDAPVPADDDELMVLE